MAVLLAERMKTVETVFSRDASIANAVKGLIGEAEISIDAALYSFDSEELFRCLLEAQNRGIQVRLLTDWNKYEQNELTRKLLMDACFPHKLSRGRNGSNSKMHHKFLILDQSIVLTGSYNWTLASETQNFENVVLIRDPDSVHNYRSEFNILWDAGLMRPKK
jgi:phosphatidylserine/phosphatidylglycerophosphate/cardiolipin synthase-like enzyme